MKWKFRPHQDNSNSQQTSNTANSVSETHLTTSLSKNRPRFIPSGSKFSKETPRQSFLHDASNSPDMALAKARALWPSGHVRDESRHEMRDERRDERW